MKKNKLLVYGCLIILFVLVFIFTIVGGAFAVGFMALNPLGGGPTGGGDAGVRENSCTTGLYPNIVDEAAYAKAIDDYIPDSSPLNGLGEYFVAGGKEAGVNPAYIVTIAKKESSFGTAGIATKGTNNAFGRTASDSQPGVHIGDRKWFKWSSWQASLHSDEDTEADYIKRMYIDDGKKTIKEIVYKYAPPGENDTEKYIKNIIEWINEINEKAGSAIDCT